MMHKYLFYWVHGSVSGQRSRDTHECCSALTLLHTVAFQTKSEHTLARQTVVYTLFPCNNREHTLPTQTIISRSAFIMQTIVNALSLCTKTRSRPSIVLETIENTLSLRRQEWTHSRYADNYKPSLIRNADNIKPTWIRYADNNENTLAMRTTTSLTSFVIQPIVNKSRYVYFDKLTLIRNTDNGEQNLIM